MKCPFDTPKQLLACAERYPVNPKEAALKESMGKALHRNLPRISKDDLLLAAEWKWRGGRTRQLCDRNSDKEVERISAGALAQNDEWIRIAAFTTLSGVGWPMASVILHFVFLSRGNLYPILDKRALAAVGAKQPPLYSGRLWDEYRTCCRDAANRHRVDMRTLDRALWIYGGETLEARKSSAKRSNR